MALTPVLPGIIMFISITILSLVVGLNLLYKYIKTRIKNLVFIAGFNLGASLAALNSMFNAYSDEIIYDLTTVLLYFLCLVFLSLFMRFTFYKDKKSPFTLILAISTVLLLTSLISKTISPTSEKNVFYFLNSLSLDTLILMSGYWYGLVAMKQYTIFKNQNIQPWIQKRYLISSVTAICFGTFGLTSIIFLIINWDLEIRALSLLSLLITTVLLMTFNIGSLVAWVMPERLKLYFNKSYETTDEIHLTEEEIMKQLMEG